MGCVFLFDEPIGFEEEMVGSLMVWDISVAFLAANLKERVLGLPQSASSLVFRWRKRNLELKDLGVQVFRAVSIVTKMQMLQKELQVRTCLASLSPGCILEADDCQQY